LSLAVALQRSAEVDEAGPIGRVPLLRWDGEDIRVSLVIGRAIVVCVEEQLIFDNGPANSTTEVVINQVANPRIEISTGLELAVLREFAG
jgi:hypothetical protein